VDKKEEGGNNNHKAEAAPAKISAQLQKYNDAITHFEAMELMALEVFDKGQNMTKEEVLKEINDRGIYYWNESISLIQSIDSLDIPNELHIQDILLIEYCQMRLAQYKLLYRAINEDTKKYDKELAAYEQLVKEKIEELQQFRRKNLN
jgi:rhomboid protease GluP